MKNREFIGIDVSKNVLDIFILKVKFHFVVSNDPAGFAKLLEICCIKLSCTKDNLFYCFENTGRYSRLLSIFFHESGIMYSMVPALDIKQSKGMTRGKSDKKDAKSIALYAWRKRDELVPTKLHSAEVGQLRQLLALRDKLIKHRTAYKNAIKDLHDCFYEGETEFIRQTQLRLIKQLNIEINSVEQQIENIIQAMHEWKTNYKLIQTVRGIGPVIAKYFIIYTENFTRFSDPKKFACFAGIAPFEYSSGSSIKGKTKLHPCANKHLKSLLNIAAMGAVQLKGEYKTYYQRRTQEGKNKMSTLNIIRNKLVLRVFAVVKRQTPYVDLSTFAA
jgi:transposase